MKKCKSCGVPLEGLMYKWVAHKIFGVKPSAKAADLCNKCLDKPEKKACGCCR